MATCLPCLTTFSEKSIADLLMSSHCGYDNGTRPWENLWQRIMRYMVNTMGERGFRGVILWIFMGYNGIDSGWGVTLW